MASSKHSWQNIYLNVRLKALISIIIFCFLGFLHELYPIQRRDIADVCVKHQSINQSHTM